MSDHPAAPGVTLPETSFEDRSILYKEIEQFISPGFMVSDVKIRNVKLSLRSLLPRDVFFLMRRSDHSDDEWMKWAIAHSIWMVDGYSVLDDINFPVHAYKMVDKLERGQIRKLFHIQSILSKKMEESIEVAKVYSIEDVSRQIWRQKGNLPANSPMVTGILGTEYLGLNIIQRVWMVYNEYQDESERSKEIWANSKMVASSMNPKGIKKMEDRDKAKEARADELKQDKFDTTYYKYIGLIKSDETLDGGRKIQKKVKSVEDLVKEYRDWVDGNLDFHDKIILEYKESIKKKREEEERVSGERQFEITSNSISGDDSNEVRFYDMNQMREILSIKPQSGIQKVYEGQEPIRNDLYNKYISGDTSSIPNKRVDSGEEGGKSLQEKIESRNPRFSKK